MFQSIRSRRSMSLSMLWLFAFLGAASPAFAQAAPEIVQCQFERMDSRSDLTLLVPPPKARLKSQAAALSVVPGTSTQEVPATARYVPPAKSEVGAEYIRVGFLLDAPYGFVLQVARTGDAFAYAFNLDTKTQVPGRTHLGTCSNATSLYTLWNF